MSDLTDKELDALIKEHKRTAAAIELRTRELDSAGTPSAWLAARHEATKTALRDLLHIAHQRRASRRLETAASHGAGFFGTATGRRRHFADKASAYDIENPMHTAGARQ